MPQAQAYKLFDCYLCVKGTNDYCEHVQVAARNPRAAKRMLWPRFRIDEKNFVWKFQQNQYIGQVKSPPKYLRRVYP